MKYTIIVLGLLLTGCVSIEKNNMHEKNVTPELSKGLVDDEHEDEDYGVAIGNCTELTNSAYCKDQERQTADDKKQLDQSLKKHSKTESIEQ
ncbi:hypothetical protein AADZ86_16390 [Colwelliaceae bacterium BS250]